MSDTEHPQKDVTDLASEPVIETTDTEVADENSQEKSSSCINESCNFAMCSLNPISMFR